MASNKQVCDVSPSTGMTTSQSNEHLRKAKDAAGQKRWSGNYDPTREHLNFEVTKGGVVAPVNKDKSIPRRINENLKARGIKKPEPIKMKDGTEKKRIIVENLILGGSREQMHRLAFGDQHVNLNKGSDNRGIVRQKDIERWAVDTYNFLAQKYGEDNIAAFVVHLDETNPHVHATVLPITKDGKFSHNKLFGGKDGSKITALHDEFAEVNKKYGLGRGESVKVTGAKHRSMEQYKAWQKTEYDKMIDGWGEQDNQIKTLTDELPLANRRVKGLMTMLKNLEKGKAEIEAEISALEEQLKNGQPDEELIQRKKSLEKELKAVKDKVKERKDQLEKAEEQLKAIANRKVQIESQTQQLEDDIKRFKKEEPGRLEEEMKQFIEQSEKEQTKTIDVKSTLEGLAQNRIFSNAVEKYGNIVELKENSLRDKKALDDTLGECSILEDIAMNCNKVAAVASALFLGYVDAATDFAQSHGGGGGGPSSGWGRDKGDDDEAWRRKCLFMGMQMMRPAGSRLKKGPKGRTF